MSIVHDNYIIRRLQVVDMRRDQDADLVLEVAVDAVVEQVLADSGVDGAQWVVEQKDVSVGVERAGDADSSPLAAAQVDVLLAYQGVHAERQQFQILLQRTHLDDPVEFSLVVGMAEDYVLLDAGREHPRLLRHVENFAFDVYVAFYCLQLAE